MTSSTLPRRRPRRFRPAAAVAAVAGLLAVAGLQLASAPSAGAATASAAARGGSGTGFSVPFSGPSRYESLAPTLATSPSQINQPLGQAKADAIATQLGLNKAYSFTRQQYLAFISGGGVGGSKDAAKLVDGSVVILTNTTGRPLISNVNGVPTPSVLGSYGLFVTRDGLLESPAHDGAPTREINNLLTPTGYLNTWALANGAGRSLVMLYRSPYLVEAGYGYVAQHISGDAQLVTNRKGGVVSTVGMSMAPALWLVNFILMYTLNPELAAAMPAYWTPIPPVVASAIYASEHGQVPFADYRNSFPQG
jgi:hypothetical protein